MESTPHAEAQFSFATVEEAKKTCAQLRSQLKTLRALYRAACLKKEEMVYKNKPSKRPRRETRVYYYPNKKPVPSLRVVAELQEKIKSISAMLDISATEYVPYDSSKEPVRSFYFDAMTPKQYHNLRYKYLRDLIAHMESEYARLEQYSSHVLFTI